MKRPNRSIARAVVALAGLAAAGPCLAADFPETEPNETKAQANVIAAMAPGDTISGLTTGTSTTVGGDASADTFDITTTAAGTPGIYQYRLVITTTGTAGHSGTIRGLTQTSAGVITAGTDATIQTSSTTSTPPRFVQWYANETPSRIYYRITGGATTTSAYTVTLERAAVTPNVVPSMLAAGPIVWSTVGQTSADTDLWIYDANFVAINDAGNDDATVIGGAPATSVQSHLQRNLPAGTYYLALSNYNLQNDKPLPADENGRGENVADFPNALCTSSTATAADNDFIIGNRCVGTQAITNTRANIFDVTFWRFTLTGPTLPDPTLTTTAGSATPATVPQGGSTLLSVTFSGGTPTGVTANLTAFGLSSAEAFADPELDNTWTYTLNVPGAQPTGTFNINVVGADASGCGASRTLTVTIPPANDACATALPISVGTPLIGSSAGATNESPTPPTCNGFSTFNLGVWYTFTEGATARRLNVTTCDANTNFNTRVYVYSGSCSALACVSANALASPACGVRADAASVTWCTTPGTQYFFLVTNDTTGTGTYGLSLTDTGAGCAPPPNDQCTGAINITSVPFNAAPFVDTATADADVSCNNAANVESRGGVWYRYTPSEPGTFFFTESGTADVVFTVFTGADCMNLSEVYCNTNETGAAAAAGVAGTTYYILVSMASETAVLPSGYTLVLNYIASSGACCNGTSCTVTAGMAACTGSGGTFLGYGLTCGGGPLPENFNGADVAIPDFSATPSPVQSTINVTDTSVITDLDVWVTMNHTFIGDVYVRLLGPNGTTIDLIKRPNIVAPCTPGVIGDPDDMVGTYTFDDEAASSLHAATIDADTTAIIASGRYRSSTCTGTLTSLDAASPAGFGGIPANGTWTLIVSDEDEAIVGTLEGFGIVINGVEQNTPCNASGACCQGATCAALSSAACTGPNTSYSGNGTTCNVFGMNNTTPCCFADFNHIGGVGVQDIFDFLAAYFTSSSAADINGGGLGVQDIFDFLAVYFSGCA